MSEKLKPCPFPHDPAIEKDASRHLGDITPFVIRDEISYRAMCPVCGAHGPEEENEGNAIAAWNRRADSRIEMAREALKDCIARLQGGRSLISEEWGNETWAEDEILSAKKALAALEEVTP